MFLDKEPEIKKNKKKLKLKGDVFPSFIHSCSAVVQEAGGRWGGGSLWQKKIKSFKLTVISSLYCSKVAPRASVGLTLN